MEVIHEHICSENKIKGVINTNQVHLIPFLKHNSLCHRINNILASLAQLRLLPRDLMFRTNMILVL